MRNPNQQSSHVWVDTQRRQREERIQKTADFLSLWFPGVHTEEDYREVAEGLVGILDD